MITYTLMAVFTSNLVFAGVSGAIAGEIKSGGYNKYIVLPVSHLRWKIAEFMGDKLFAIIVVFIGMAVVLGLLAVNRLFVPELSGVLSYLIVLIPAIALQFLLNYCVAGCAFWMGEIGGIFTIINIINAIVSGGVFPLDIFGPVVVAISKVLPFYYTTYFAVNVFIGRISGAELFEGIVVMLCWIAVLYVVVCIVWARGMRRYIAAGG
jgi:ABC-2 type transport system permease protein